LMHLGFDFSYTYMGGRWRLPGSWPGRSFPDVGMYEEVARIAERGLLDMIFSGDGTGVPDTWRGASALQVHATCCSTAPTPHRRAVFGLSRISRAVVTRSCGVEDTGAEEWEAGSAIHGPLQHLEPVDLAFGRACRPG